VVNSWFNFLLLPICILGLSNEDDDKEASEDTSKDTDDKSDDTSEDTSEEDSSDDTEEGGEEDSSQDDSEEEEDITKSYFTDPDKLDPKLRGAFKRMQAIFTKSNQRALSVVKQAQAFQRLAVMPEFKQWLEDRNAKIVGKKVPKRTNEDDSEEDGDDETPITRKALKKMLAEFAEETTKPIREERQQEKLEVAAEKFKKDNRDWEMYRESMDEVWDIYPNLDFQDCYELAKQKQDKVINTKKSLNGKKNANTFKPNRMSAGNRVEKDKKGKRTFQEAAALALKTLGMGKDKD